LLHVVIVSEEVGHILGYLRDRGILGRESAQHLLNLALAFHKVFKRDLDLRIVRRMVLKVSPLVERGLHLTTLLPAIFSLLASHSHPVSISLIKEDSMQRENCVEIDFHK